jgi:5'-nucleotidase/UDP-sugar diphosphatase
MENMLRVDPYRQDFADSRATRFVVFTILQFNDVYDAMPVEGGQRVGLARVTTLYQQLREENPNVFSVMVGDFLAPSAIGAITSDGGYHMIEALNTFGLTYATMGNHEFDVSQFDLLQCILDSRFTWIVSNVKDGQGKPFIEVEDRALCKFQNAQGEEVRFALIGLCTDMIRAC